MLKSEKKTFIASGTFFYGVILIWILVNIFQSASTGLLNDEAYYWFYAKHIAWGYYDHPPMIALVIKAGGLLFNNEIGVRFFIVLFSVAFLFLLKKLSEAKDYLLFFAFVFSVFILQAEGFITTPDTVFVFFLTLFFYSYKLYLKDDSVKNILLLVISITGMFYSKYFALLVVLFTVAGNLKIAKRKSFWIIFVVSSAAMIPHLLWQIDHDFVTFYFHLKERNVNSDFGFSTVFEFFGGQILMMNPIIAFFLIAYVLKYKTVNDFDRVLWFNVAGILGFAFFISFFKRVESNWTVAAFVPLIFMSYQMLEKDKKIRKKILLLSLVSILLILFLRINFVFDIFSVRGPKILNQFHGWGVRSVKIEKLAQGNPVVFSCSYQNASQYIFHTGDKAFTFNNLFYRKNQFDLLNIEPELLGKKVLFIKDSKVLDKYYKKPFVIPSPDSIYLYNKWWYYKFIEKYYSFNFLSVKINLENHKLLASDDITIPVELINPLDSSLTIPEYVESYLTVCFAEKNRPYKFNKVEKISGLKIDKFYKTDLQVKTPSKPGKYYLWVSVQTGWLPPGINNRIFEVTVKKRL
jgi:hypothetical protein